MFRSPPVSQRELLTACPIPARCSDARVPRHRLLIHSTSFARFEVIWVQSTRLTHKATDPGQLLVQSSLSESSQAPPALGHTSSLCTSVFHAFICRGNVHPDPCCSTEAALTLLFMPTVRKRENQKKIKAKGQIITGFSQ